MQVLLTKDIRKLGHVGDIVDVKPGYARNYLYPQLMAIEPTEENLKSIEEARRVAAAERARRLEEHRAEAERMKDVTVTIEMLANAEGTLYGSVGPKEIAHALQQAGHAVRPEFIILDRPIRTLDKRMVRVEFTDELAVEVKLWVVRAGGSEEEPEEESAETEPQEATGDGSE
jgi:large subunit ribosomal protein L9